MGELSRRELLRSGLAVGASALTYEALGEGLPAAAAPRPRGCGARLRDIEHIVVLIQENRSFDEFFGAFPGVRGFDDHRNRQAFAQAGYSGRGSRNGRLLPFRMDGRKAIGQCFGNEDFPTHAWAPQHASWNHGRNDAFYKAHAIRQWDGPLAVNLMGYYERQDIPYYWALAREFTLCDMFFSSVLGPTQPNRLYSISASIDPAGTRGGPNVATFINRRGMAGDFRWTTMPEQLQARGITWNQYTSPLLGQFVNPLTAFRRFQSNPELARRGTAPTYPNDFEADLERDALPAVSWVQLRRSPNRSTRRFHPPPASMRSTSCCERSGGGRTSGARRR